MMKRPQIEGWEGRRLVNLQIPMRLLCIMQYNNFVVVMYFLFDSSPMSIQIILELVSYVEYSDRGLLFLYVKRLTHCVMSEYDMSCE